MELMSTFIAGFYLTKTNLTLQNNTQRSVMRMNEYLLQTDRYSLDTKSIFSEPSASPHKVNSSTSTRRIFSSTLIL